MNLTATERSALLAAESAMDWDRACDQMKDDRGGQYPPDWAEFAMSPEAQAVQDRLSSEQVVCLWCVMGSF